MPLVAANVSRKIVWQTRQVWDLKFRKVSGMGANGPSWGMCGPEWPTRVTQHHSRSHFEMRVGIWHFTLELTFSCERAEGGKVVNKLYFTENHDSNLFTQKNIFDRRRHHNTCLPSFHSPLSPICFFLFSFFLHIFHTLSVQVFFLTFNKDL